jgi:hypothetical protein
MLSKIKKKRGRVEKTQCYRNRTAVSLENIHGVTLLLVYTNCPGWYVPIDSFTIYQ